MMRYILVISFMIFGSYNLTAQTVRDSILMRKSFLGTVFTQYNASVLPGEMMERMQSNPQAVAEMKLARKSYNRGMALGFVGGAIASVPVLQYLTGSNDPIWILAPVGGAVALTGIPFARKYKRQAVTAVNTYNAGLTKTGYIQPELQIDFGFNRAAFRISF